MYSPQLGRFLSRDPLVADQPDIFHDNNWFGGRLTMMRNLYGYADNNPVNYTDPSGLVPKFPGKECAGTVCEAGGVKTYQNPNADPSCKHPCKAYVVDAHEKTHRMNMGACCDAKNKCLKFTDGLGLPPATVMKWKQLCNNAWNLWRAVNNDSLELRAAANSCEAAKWLVSQTCGCQEPTIPVEGCCEMAKAELYLCKGNDPKAKIEPCPFKADGQVDNDLYNKLLQIYQKQNPPKP